MAEVTQMIAVVSDVNSHRIKHTTNLAILWFVWGLQVGPE